MSAGTRLRHDNFFKGNPHRRTADAGGVDVNGIGYEVLIPLSSFEKLPGLGQAVTLKTQLVVREDSQTLYGFATDAERELFKMIQGVSGIGPRLALNVLSGMNVTSFKGAIGDGDVKRLSSINGIGKKTAERMVLELKDKVGMAAALQRRLAKRRRRRTRPSPMPRRRSRRWAPSRPRLKRPPKRPKRCSARRRLSRSWSAPR